MLVVAMTLFALALGGLGFALKLLFTPLPPPATDSTMLAPLLHSPLSDEESTASWDLV